MPPPIGSNPPIAVTDHAVERFRQRVRSSTGELDKRPEIIGRVARAWQAGRVSAQPPAGAAAQRGSVYVRDLDDDDLVFVCLHDRPRNELLVVTVWEEGQDAAVPRRFTDAIRERRRPTN
jgi:hypothetical protein